MGGRNRDGPDLMEGQEYGPVLKAPLEYEHDRIAPADSPGNEQIGGLIREALHIGVGELSLGSGFVAPEQSPFPAFFFGQDIHYIPGKIEILRDIHLKVVVKILIGFKIFPGQKSVKQFHIFLLT
jgi:hypothetical protein